MHPKSTKNWLLMDFSLLGYPEALDLQYRLVQAKTTGKLTRDVIILLEHPPVFTLGRRGNREHLLVAEAFLRAQGIQLIHVERGGDITYHGPGQLVGYPLVDLKGGWWRIKAFIEALEEVMIRTASDWGIVAERNSINRGVWVGDHKLGSVGIALRRWVSYHGLALNVNNSLEPFTWTHPCGLEGIQMTSMRKVLGQEIPMAGVRGALCSNVQHVFGVKLNRVDPEEITSPLVARADAMIEKQNAYP